MGYLYLFAVREVQLSSARVMQTSLYSRWCACGWTGGELVPGAGEEARSADLLGVRLLHARHHVDGRLRRHCLRDAHRSLLHGLLHPRRPRKSPSNRSVVVGTGSKRYSRPIPRTVYRYF